MLSTYYVHTSYYRTRHVPLLLPAPFRLVRRQRIIVLANRGSNIGVILQRLPLG